MVRRAPVRCRGLRRGTSSPMSLMAGRWQEPEQTPASAHARAIPQSRCARPPRRLPALPSDGPRCSRTDSARPCGAIAISRKKKQDILA